MCECPAGGWLMNINTVGFIYEFRPLLRGGETKMASRFSAQSEPNKSGQLDLFEPSMAARPTSDAPTAKAVVQRTADGVSTLLDRFFAEKVRRHDRDNDGCLSREEFSGTDDEFMQLDEDSDGLVSPPDFKRQFLADNPPLRGMVEGFAGGLYDRLMNSPNAEPDALAGTVRRFFEDFVQQYDSDGDGTLRTDEFPGTNEELHGVLLKRKDEVTVEDLVAGFRQQNPDLAELRESLLQLKEAVQPAEVRPRQLDLYT